VKVLVTLNVLVLIFGAGYFFGIRRGWESMSLEECWLDKHNEIDCQVFVY